MCQHQGLIINKPPIFKTELQIGSWGLWKIELRFMDDSNSRHVDQQPHERQQRLGWVFVPVLVSNGLLDFYVHRFHHFYSQQRFY